MLRNAVAYLLIYCFSFNTSFAQSALGPEKMNINQLMIRYDYLLSAHPQAHEEAFQKETLVKFKEELLASVVGAGKEELKATYEDLLLKIPEQKKREAYRKILENSTKEEIAAFLASPELLASSLRGEGSNFTATNGNDALLLNILLISFGALIIVTIISSIVEHINHEYFNSYSVTAGECSYVALQANASALTIADMKEDARINCETHAIKPETCEFNGWRYYEDSYYSIYYPHDTYSNCNISAKYKARK